MVKKTFLALLAGTALVGWLFPPGATAQNTAQQPNSPPPSVQKYPPPYGPYGRQGGHPALNAPYAGSPHAQSAVRTLGYPFNALSLTAEQKAKIEAIQKETHQQMLALFKQAEPDARKLWVLTHSGTFIPVQQASQVYDAMSQVQKKLFMLRIRSWNRALAVLTKDQRTQLSNLLRRGRPPIAR